MLIKHCRMCLRKVEPVFELTPTPIANSFPEQADSWAMKYPLGLSQCTSCGHVQIGFEIPGSELYTGYKYQTPEAERTRLEKYAQDLAKKYPNALDKGAGTQRSQGKPTVLEIGCNNGMFCDELFKAGFYPIGMDPCSTRWGGLPKWFNTKSARAIAQSIGQMKLIVANNVLAHVDDLRNVLLGVKYLLAPDGHLVFEVQYLPDLVSGGMFDMIYHEHKDYHTLAPWPYLLSKFGMGIKEIERIPTHGGSIRVHVGFGDGIPIPKEERIDWKRFGDLVEFAKNAVKHRLEITPGRIVAFGATAKACTLIHHFGVADHISYCVDETPAKQGRYIPGTSIQISPPERLKEEPPAAVLLTAWNYAEILRPRFECEVIVPFKQAA